MLFGSPFDQRFADHVEPHKDLAKAQPLLLLVEAELLGQRQFELLRGDVVLLNQVLAEHLRRDP